MENNLSALITILTGKPPAAIQIDWTNPKPTITTDRETWLKQLQRRHPKK